MQAFTQVSLRANAVLIVLCRRFGCGMARHLRMLWAHPNALESLVVRPPFSPAPRSFCSRCGGSQTRVRCGAPVASYRTRANGAQRLVIAHPSSRDWLVQLHVELHPAQSRRSVAHACGHAVSYCRVPRDRA
ncbi:hypothetical protein BRCH_00818 [Candidatus Burkholderia brachyanthoides]|nr:hypothetical protein BRCH_00818 [Candidatus Burkholderia brachyanthoides]